MNGAGGSDGGLVRCGLQFELKIGFENGLKEKRWFGHGWVLRRLFLARH